MYLLIVKIWNVRFVIGSMMNSSSNLCSSSGMISVVLLICGVICVIYSVVVMVIVNLGMMNYFLCGMNFV